MSWQRGSGKPDPRASDVDADYPLAIGPRQWDNVVEERPWKTLVRRFSRASLLIKDSIPGRRAAIGVVSALLLMGSVFLPLSRGNPGYAWPILSDGVESVGSAPSAQVTDPDNPAPRETLQGLRLNLPGLRRVNDDPAPSPKLDPLPAWVQSTRSAALWAGSEASAAQLRSVPANTHLRVLGQAERGRLPVYTEGGSQQGDRLGGWMDLGDVVASKQPSNQPADPPRVTASSRGGLRPNPDISTPEKFLAAVGEAAQESQRASQVPASVTIAQAILESDWGKSLLSKKGNNFFGIKAISGPGPAGVISMNTWEVLNGSNVVIKDAFKAYNNIYESILDHGRFLRDNARYAPAFKFPDNPQEFARRIHAAGYATDPAYSTKLINLMNKFNLYQYDLKP